MQTHAGQESRECPQKIGADRSSIFRVIMYRLNSESWRHWSPLYLRLVYWRRDINNKRHLVAYGNGDIR